MTVNGEGDRRLFLGTPLDGPVVSSVKACYQRREELNELSPGRIRWVKPENWHLTWVFLGNTPESRIAGIQTQLDDLLPSVEAFNLDLKTLTLWPSPRRPQLIVLEGDKSSAPTQALAKTLQQCFPEAETYRTFKPHITLARIKPGKDTRTLTWPSLVDWFSSSHPWRVHRVQLIESQLTPEGAIYYVLAEWTFAVS